MRPCKCHHSMNSFVLLTSCRHPAMIQPRTLHRIGSLTKAMDPLPEFCTQHVQNSAHNFKEFEALLSLCSNPLDLENTNFNPPGC